MGKESFYFLAFCWYSLSQKVNIFFSAKFVLLDFPFSSSDSAAHCVCLTVCLYQYDSLPFIVIKR